PICELLWRYCARVVDGGDHEALYQRRQLLEHVRHVLVAHRPENQLPSGGGELLTQGGDQGLDPLLVVGAVDEDQRRTGDGLHSTRHLGRERCLTHCLDVESPIEQCLHRCDRHDQVVQLVTTVERDEDIGVLRLRTTQRRQPASHTP